MKKLNDYLDELIKAKSFPVGTVHNGRKKVAEGKWVPVSEGVQAPKNKLGRDENSPTQKELTVQEHQSQANVHFDEALKYSETLNQLRDKVSERRKIDKNYKVPEKAQRLLDAVKAKAEFHKKQYEHHRSQGKQNWKQGQDSGKLESEKLQTGTKRAKEAQSSYDKKKITKSLNDILKSQSSFYVGMVVINQKGQVLLGKRKEDGIWTGPGGGSGVGESPMDTAKREAFEEAGLNLDNCIVKELPTLVAKDKKPIFTFIVYCTQDEFTTALDPDNEVESWNWIDPINFTEDMKKDSNRFTTILNALSEYYSIKKSIPDILLKGGPGSGRTTGTGYDSDLAVRNWNKKKNTKEEQIILNQLKDKLKDTLKNRNKQVNKSLISVDDQGSAIETSNFNIDQNSAEPMWLEIFHNTMENYNYGDAPRTIHLTDGYSIIMSKVDDGLYSGFIRQTVDQDGESPLEETVGKVEKQTIPSIISYLKAKEYIKFPQVREEINVIDSEPVVEPLEKEIIDTSGKDTVIKLINLLDRLL